MISPAQIRAARALLGLTQSEVATIADVGLATIQRIESSNAEMSGSARTLLKLKAGFEELGIVFTARDDEYEYGVKLRKSESNN